jgi:hypothetical protein
MTIAEGFIIKAKAAALSITAVTMKRFFILKNNKF